MVIMVINIVHKDLILPGTFPLRRTTLMVIIQETLLQEPLIYITLPTYPLVKLLIKTAQSQDQIGWSQILVGRCIKQWTYS